MKLSPPTESFLGRLRVHPYARAAMMFVAALLLGFLAWPLVSGGCSALFRVLCELVLSPLEFGQGGHVAFSSALGATALERASSWDVRMALSIQGVDKAHAVALNARRLFFLPLLTLLASVLALPMSVAARRRALLVGTPILVALALSTVWLSAVFLFARVPGLVYALSPAESALLRLGYEGFATPLTTKFALPLLLAYGLFAGQNARPPEVGAPAKATALASPRSNADTVSKRRRVKRAARARRS